MREHLFYALVIVAAMAGAAMSITAAALTRRAVVALLTARAELAAARYAVRWLWGNGDLYTLPPVEVSLAVKVARVARGER
jgi:hypothetical protein